MTIINSNLGALRAQNGSRLAQAGLDTSMQRLSTGLRINSAKDDAAGLAITQRMTSEIRGLNMAIRNSSDGISLAQTAESAMGEVTNMLQRMRELAVQSASGTMDEGARAGLQAEIKQLISEVDNVASRTAFNGIKLLDGSSTKLDLQTGARAGETVSLNIGSAKASDLGTGNAPGLSATGQFAASAAALITAGTLRPNDLTINGVVIRGSAAADDQLSFSGKDASAVAKAAAINAASDQTGVKAVVNSTVMTGSNMTAGGAASATGTVTINGVVTQSITTTANNSAASRTSIVNAINAISGQTGVVATDTGDDRQGITLAAADGRNIEVSLTTLTALNTGLKVGVQTGSYSLVAEQGDAIEIGYSGSGDLSRSGLAAGRYERGVSTVTTDQRVAPVAAATALGLQTGDLIINGVAIGASRATADTVSDTRAVSSRKEASSIAIAAAINDATELTGVTATANATAIVATSTIAAAVTGGTILINGVLSAPITTLATDSTQSVREKVIGVINANSGVHGVVASDNGKGGLTLTAIDGRNISVNTSAAATSFGLGAATIEGSSVAYAVATHTVTAGAGVYNAATATAYGTVTLSSSKTINVASGSQGFSTNNYTALGFESNSYGSDAGGLKIKDLDISSQVGATEALGAIDEALNTIAINRAELGAIQNRLEATINNLTSASNNTVASRSRIEDADFAVETTNLARGQILTQAAQAMLAQANQSSQNVLQLLR